MQFKLSRLLQLFDVILFRFHILTLLVSGGGGKFVPPLSYFNIAPKLKRSFPLMHPDFESNLIKHIFRKFGVCGTTGSDITFLLLEAPKEFYAVLSTMHAYQCAYSVHCTAYSLSMLIFNWNKVFYLQINALHHYYVIDDGLIQKS